MSVYLTAVLTAKSGSAETLKALLQDLVVYAKKEEACLQYELYQSAEDEIYLFFKRPGKARRGWISTMATLYSGQQFSALMKFGFVSRTVPPVIRTERRSRKPCTII
jgi:hypothetical protein